MQKEEKNQEESYSEKFPCIVYGGPDDGLEFDLNVTQVENKIKLPESITIFTDLEYFKCGLTSSDRIRYVLTGVEPPKETA